MVCLLPCPALLLLITPSSSSSYLQKTCFNFSPNPIVSIRIVSKSTSISATLSNTNSQHHHMWEDPTSSDYDSQEDDDDDAFVDTIASDNSLTTAVSDSEIRFITEVDQLLTPEERKILEENEDPVITKISTTKWGLLQTLALSQQIPFMDKMLVQGVPVDDPDKDGLTALHKAIIGKREAVISHLLRKGANPHVRDKDGATPLHYAVQVGAMQTVKLLIKYKADVNAEDNEGWTPLHVAIQSRCRNIAKVLLVNGADKTRRTKRGISVLELGLCYGKDFKSYDLVKLLKLVPAGIDP